ncbi:MAG: HAD family hydrolase [Hyphomicrobiales bacterium]|nr:HAD family hydrolase [Hyphomicrobiales bacterium]
MSVTAPDRVGLVIFDCDGVLVDSEPLAAQVMAEMATIYGVPLMPRDCIDRFTGVSLARVRAALEAELGRPLPGDFEAEVRARDFAAFKSGLRPIDGADAVLRTIKTAKCVASSGAPEKIRFTLGLTGLLPLLEPYLFSASMVSRGKPAPDLFLYAAAQMGHAPQACVVIEDAEPGIRAARAAGMTALGFTGGGHCGPSHGEHLRKAGAHLVFRRMAELPDLLDGLVRDP